MIREGRRPIVALCAAIFAAMALGACGDSDPATTGSSTAAKSGAQEAGKESSQREESRADKESSAEKGESGAGRAVAPLRVSGDGSEQFRTPGGDNSIQDFGEEADESELEEAARALHGYFAARAEEEWAKACSYLSTTLKQQLGQLASRPGRLEGKSCAGFLEGATVPLPASARRETTMVDAHSLRREDERAFLIYSGAEAALYVMLMDQEDGSWRVGALEGTPLS